MLLESTPIEEYMVLGHTISVKRDDLYGQPPAPPLAKLRGAKLLLEKLKEQGIGKVAVYDTSVSKAGQGIAYLCNELSLQCLAGFPLAKGSSTKPQQEIARELGAELLAMKAGRTAVCYAQFKKEATERGYYVLPLGLVCQETVAALAEQSALLGDNYKNIILCTGSGTIATGIALGTRTAVIGVSCGMSTSKQWKRINQLAYPNVLFNLQLIEPKYGYYHALDTDHCPFPTSPYYDMKAWDWLVTHTEELQHPVLFWNIGV